MALVLVLREDESQNFKITLTKNVNRDYFLNQDGNVRNLQIFAVFPSDPEKFHLALQGFDKYRVKNHPCWFSVSHQEVRQFMTDLVAENQK